MRRVLFQGGMTVVTNLEQAIAKAGSPVKLLWDSQTPPSVVPRVAQEYRNWRDEQLAWRRTAVLYDQCHHMADLNIKGPDALKLISDLAINSVANFPVDMAKQFVAVSHDGYVIGDNILFHLEEDEFQAVGIPTSINRSEERRVGKECRSRRWQYHYKKPPRDAYGVRPCYMQGRVVAAGCGSALRPCQLGKTVERRW